MNGTTFGRYLIIDKLGQGGMGEVFLAQDPTLERKVALKLLPEALAGAPEFRERFLVEARAAAALSHPNICVIHEVGEVDGRPFIAMEHVEGETLEARVKAGSLDLASSVDIMCQVLAGLGAAHERGIVHRDIKSSNIMITAGGQAKVMDFGLAKVRGGPALTASHTTLGTVGYMSPEQAEGKEVDHRSDLWSAGVLLYEMLTGALPFAGEQDVVVLHHIMFEKPMPLTRRDPSVPRELSRVVLRALEKDPRDRYSSAAEMAAELRAYEEGLRVEEAGVLNVRSLGRLLRRPRVAVGVAVTVLAMGIVLAGFVRRRADVRWARAQAIPEIRRLIGENDVWRNLLEPYRLAERAESVLGADPELAELMDKVSLTVGVRTDPAGATVSYQPYGSPDSAWSFLGVTPLEGVRVPIGIFRWKLEKDGYQTVEAAAATWDIGGEDLIVGHDLVRTLDEEGSVPRDMVRVPAMEMASGALPAFFIGRHEVTNREYKAFVDAGGYRERQYWRQPFVRDGRQLGWEAAMAGFVDRSGRPGPATWVGGDFPAGHDDYPVSGVSWYEAAAYAAYAGMSLPTTDHWEAARGGRTPMVQWPQLGGFGVLAPFSNFGGDGPVAVGSLRGITAYGAYDMPGNVREWCWNETPQGRMVRGGAWEDNSYAFGSPAQAPAMDRSPRNGIRLAVYPDSATIPDAAFAPRQIVRRFDPRAVPRVSDGVFRAYTERFSYDPTPLDGRVESSAKSPGGWTHEVVSFDAAYGGERMLAHLFLPSNAAPPFQTVVYFPGSASTMMPSSEDLESYYEFSMFLSYLVRSGRAVVYPVYKGTFERGRPEYVTLHAGDDSHAYVQYVTQLVQDVRRTLDYLETRPDVDATRLAYYGMSWGGKEGPIITAVEPRFGASVLLAAGAEYEPPLPRPEARSLTYAPRVRTPTLILNGRYDVLFPPEASSRPLFELLGTPSADKRLILYETDHIPPRTEYIKETLAWLDRYLGPVQR